mmetsp:Transcript_45130/g.144552  ORF Transcript_45130/g.144552 Transcript_45130/m.144552 type:complete len:299 (+) Transcript_45130:1805-2701(+)
MSHGQAFTMVKGACTSTVHQPSSGELQQGRMCNQCFGMSCMPRGGAEQTVTAPPSETLAGTEKNGSDHSYSMPPEVSGAGRICNTTWPMRSCASGGAEKISPEQSRSAPLASQTGGCRPSNAAAASPARISPPMTFASTDRKALPGSTGVKPPVAAAVPPPPAPASPSVLAPPGVGAKNLTSKSVGVLFQTQTVELMSSNCKGGLNVTTRHTSKPTTWVSHGMHTSLPRGTSHAAAPGRPGRVSVSCGKAWPERPLPFSRPSRDCRKCSAPRRQCSPPPSTSTWQHTPDMLTPAKRWP